MFLSKRKKRAIIDSDGVLGDCHQKLIDLYNEEYGLNFQKKDIWCWDLTKIQLPNTNMIKYFEMPGFFSDLKVIEGAQEYVRKLMEKDVEIIIATASPPQGMMDKMMWFSKNFPFIPEKNILMVYRKDLLIGDFMLDDGIHNIETSICTRPILFTKDNPWTYEEKRFEKSDSWHDFYEKVINHEIVYNDEYFNYHMRREA